MEVEPRPWSTWFRGRRTWWRTCDVRMNSLRAGAPSLGWRRSRSTGTDGKVRSTQVRSDVVGLGQAMVDLAAHVDDAYLAKHELVKGERKVITHQERARILEDLDGSRYHATAGGSLANTLVALSRLGRGRIDVCMAGAVGSDAVGQYFRAQMEQAGVSFLHVDRPNTYTGTVCVLTTPDAQRTMLSCVGSSSTWDVPRPLQARIARAKVLVIEGYLWEMEGSSRAIRLAVAWARRHGTSVALTASDVTVVRRHRRAFLALLPHVDVLFANSAEARALVREADAGACASRLSRTCPFVVVTDGPRGAHVVSRGRAHHVPSHHVDLPLVDTCGAGDAYAAGVLYGMCRDMDVATTAHVGARVASAVLGQTGARLSRAGAERLASTCTSTRSVARREGGGRPPCDASDLRPRLQASCGR